VWVYICTRVGAFCLFVLSNPSTTFVCITGVFSTPVCVYGGRFEVGFFFQFVHGEPALVAGMGGYVLTGVEVGVLSYMFVYFCGC